MVLRSPPSTKARRAVCAALAGAFAATAGAQPAGLGVAHGGATVHQAGNATTVTTTNGAGSRHSALDWRSFQVPGSHAVFFAQPDASSTSINRVLGGDPTAILGTLGSNGRLVLVNPAGITVAPGALVDTAGFTASTLPLGTADAIAGRLRFSAAATDHKDSGKGDKEEAAKGGLLHVQGRVLARSGDVVLVGPDIEVGEGALVEATGGDVVLAAGRTVAVTGRGLEGIRMEVRAPGDRAVNLGTLKGDSVAIFAGQLRHSGLVQARGVTVRGGRVVLQASDEAVIDGRIEATGPTGGGSVEISAERLVLKSATTIDVSHLQGGGEIRVSGGERVDVEEGVKLKADAMLSGNGGQVSVAGKDRVEFRGEISSRGAGGGDPGKARVEAREVDFRGAVDTGRAPNRKPGGRFEEDVQVAAVPRELQPTAVQAALREPEAASDGYLAAAVRLAPLSSVQEDPSRRRVVVTALQCTVTR